MKHLPEDLIIIYHSPPRRDSSTSGRGRRGPLHWFLLCVLGDIGNSVVSGFCCCCCTYRIITISKKVAESMKSLFAVAAGCLSGDLRWSKETARKIDSAWMEPTELTFKYYLPVEIAVAGKGILFYFACQQYSWCNLSSLSSSVVELSWAHQPASPGLPLLTCNCKRTSDGCATLRFVLVRPRNLKTLLSAKCAIFTALPTRQYFNCLRDGWWYLLLTAESLPHSLPHQVNLSIM